MLSLSSAYFRRDFFGALEIPETGLDGWKTILSFWFLFGSGLTFRGPKSCVFLRPKFVDFHGHGVAELAPLQLGGRF